MNNSRIGSGPSVETFPTSAMSLLWLCLLTSQTVAKHWGANRIIRVSARLTIENMHNNVYYGDGAVIISLYIIL